MFHRMILKGKSWVGTCHLAFGLICLSVAIQLVLGAYYRLMYLSGDRYSPKSTWKYDYTSDMAYLTIPLKIWVLFVQKHCFFVMMLQIM